MIVDYLLQSYQGGVVPFLNGSWIKEVLIWAGPCAGDSVMVLIIVSSWTACC